MKVVPTNKIQEMIMDLYIHLMKTKGIVVIEEFKGGNGNDGKTFPRLMIEALLESILITMAILIMIAQGKSVNLDGFFSQAKKNPQALVAEIREHHPSELSQAVVLVRNNSSPGRKRIDLHGEIDEIKDVIRKQTEQVPTGDFFTDMERFTDSLASFASKLPREEIYGNKNNNFLNKMEESIDNYKMFAYDEPIIRDKTRVRPSSDAVPIFSKEEEVRIRRPKSDPIVRDKTRKIVRTSDETFDLNPKIRYPARRLRVRNLTETPEEDLVGIASEDFIEGGKRKKKSKKNKRRTNKRRRSKL